MNSFQPFQAWILSAALHALTFIVLVGPAYELVGDEKARRVIHRASFKDPSQSPKYSSQMLIFKWLMSSSAPEQSEDLIFFLCSMVFFWKKKMCQMETFEEKLIFFQTLLLFCFYCCCYSFQTLPFFHPSSHSSLSLFQRRVTVV